MKTIVAAIDGSAYGDRAARLAIEIAGATGAKLVLVHALDEGPLSDTEIRLAETEFARELAEETRAIAAEDGLTPADFRPETLIHRSSEIGMRLRSAIGRALLERHKSKAEAAGASEVETVSEIGPATKIIVDTAKSRGADLVVVGSHGHSTFNDFFLGSTSRRVSQMVDCSCLIAR